MRRLGLALFGLLACAVAGIAGPFNPTQTPTLDGTRAVVDLPSSQHMRNVGGSDGAGLCVFTSLQHSARWQNIVDLDGYRQWMQRRPGGGYPQKVDATLKAFCRERGVPVPDYVQHTGGDDAFLDLAIHTGRSPAVTYAGMDDFYRGGIDHMVSLAHIDQDRAAIIDNNRPGYWVWMSRKDFLTRWRARGGGWAVVFLAPPPTVYGAPPAEAIRHIEAGCVCGDECACKPGNCPAKCPVMVGQCQGGRCSGGSCSGGGCLLIQPAAPLGLGGCDGSRCPAILAPAVKPIDPPPGYTPLAGSPGWFAAPDGRCLFTGGSLPGAFDVIEGLWAPLLPTGYGPWGPVPLAVKVPAAKGAGDELPTGVVPEKVHDAPAYSLSGNPCSKEDAHAALLSDDSGRWHLAAVGDAGLLARVKADVAQLPADVRGKLHIQLYTPAAWQVGQFKLAQGVTLRKPAAGRVSSDVGTIPADGYSAGKLADLIGLPDGPAPRPLPPPPPAAPAPAPPAPSPASPETPSVMPCCLGLLVLILILSRRKEVK